MSEARTCPCKLLPRSLSSFTAAEYGDIHSLSKIKDIASRRDGAGYSPLHYAAQFNHVAATAFLLQLGCPVDGGGRCGATPLHRASFSGATAAMKVLLEWNNRDGTCSDGTQQTSLAVDELAEASSVTCGSKRCDLLAKDTSFCDESTPLHKAAGGGRYLAVHVLLEALRERDATPGSPGERSHRTPSWLSDGLTAMDKWGRTPLDVARHCYNNRETERDSVARWDAVAGGLPDWGKCVQLLQNAGEDADGANNSNGNKNRGSTGDTRKEESVTTQQQTTRKDAQTQSNGPSRRLPRLPMHLTRGVMACVDCGPGGRNEDGNAVCLTALWQRDFQKALGDSVGMCFVVPAAASPPLPAALSTNTKSGVTNEPETKKPQSTTRAAMETTGNTEITTTKKSTNVDSTCMRCQKPTVAFYPLPKLGILVCKSCRRLAK